MGSLANILGDIMNHTNCPMCETDFKLSKQRMEFSMSSTVC